MQQFFHTSRTCVFSKWQNVRVRMKSILITCKDSDSTEQVGFWQRLIFRSVGKGPMIKALARKYVQKRNMEKMFPWCLLMSSQTVWCSSVPLADQLYAWLISNRHSIVINVNVIVIFVKPNLFYGWSSLSLLIAGSDHGFFACCQKVFRLPDRVPFVCCRFHGGIQLSHRGNQSPEEAGLLASKPSNTLEDWSLRWAKSLQQYNEVWILQSWHRILPFLFRRGGICYNSQDSCWSRSIGIGWSCSKSFRCQVEVLISAKFLTN